MTKAQTNSQASTATHAIAASNEPPPDCPPDVEQLGRASWTLLHSIAATYPSRPPVELQRETSQFISTFSKLYPCWVCAEDFQSWLKEEGNAPRVSSREELGRWMCEAHNAVNEKLGKQKFDCNKWQQRWRTGWEDGRCG
jgi:mitochondrial FAD-linked sulfhydryl oxidase